MCLTINYHYKNMVRNKDTRTVTWTVVLETTTYLDRNDNFMIT